MGLRWACRACRATLVTPYDNLRASPVVRCPLARAAETALVRASVRKTLASRHSQPCSPHYRAIISRKTSQQRCRLGLAGRRAARRADRRDGVDCLARERRAHRVAAREQAHHTRGAEVPRLCAGDSTITTTRVPRASKPDTPAARKSPVSPLVGEHGSFSEGAAARPAACATRCRRRRRRSVRRGPFSRAALGTGPFLRAALSRALLSERLRSLVSR